jgi:hypothetical protein
MADLKLWQQLASAVKTPLHRSRKAMVTKKKKKGSVTPAYTFLKGTNVELAKRLFASDLEDFERDYREELSDWKENNNWSKPEPEVFELEIDTDQCDSDVTVEAKLIGRSGSEYSRTDLVTLCVAEFEHCCGMLELGAYDRLEEVPKEARTDVLKFMLAELHTGAVLSTLTAAQRKKFGTNLLEAGFQEVQKFINPNTGNTLYAYIYNTGAKRRSSSY